MATGHGAAELGGRCDLMPLFGSKGCVSGFDDSNGRDGVDWSDDQFFGAADRAAEILDLVSERRHFVVAISKDVQSF